MHYFKIDGNPVDAYTICLAHAQLESDYNVKRPLFPPHQNQTLCI